MTGNSEEMKESASLVDEIEKQLEQVLAKKRKQVENELDEKIKMEKERAKKKLESIEENLKDERQDIEEYKSAITEYESTRAHLRVAIKNHLDKAFQYQTEIEKLAGATLNELREVRELSEKLGELRAKVSEKTEYLRNKLEEKFGIVTRIPGAEEVEERVVVDLEEELTKLRKIKEILGRSEAAQVVERAIREVKKGEEGKKEEKVFEEEVEEEKKEDVEEVIERAEEKEEKEIEREEEPEEKEAVIEKPEMPVDEMEVPEISDVMDISPPEEIDEEEPQPEEAEKEEKASKEIKEEAGEEPEEIEKEEKTEQKTEEKKEEAVKEEAEVRKETIQKNKEQAPAEEKKAPHPEKDVQGVGERVTEAEKKTPEQEEGEVQAVSAAGSDSEKKTPLQTRTIPKDKQVVAEIGGMPFNPADREEMLGILENFRKVETVEGNGKIYFFQRNSKTVLDSEKIISTIKSRLEKARKYFREITETKSPKDQFFIKQEIINNQELLRKVILRGIKKCERESWGLPEHTSDVLDVEKLKDILEKLSLQNWSNREEFQSFKGYFDTLNRAFYAKIIPYEPYLKSLILQLS